MELEIGRGELHGEVLDVGVGEVRVGFIFCSSYTRQESFDFGLGGSCRG